MAYPEDAGTITPLVDGTDYMEDDNVNTVVTELEATKTLIGIPGAAQSHLATLLSMLIGNRIGGHCTFNSITEVDISAFRGIIPNAAESINKARVKTSSVTVDNTDLDTGAAFTNSTQHYIYATADGSSSEPVYKISINASTPSGYTNYIKLGGFYVDGSGNIEGVWTYLDDGRKQYSSGWFAIAINTVYTKNHGLGTGEVVGHIIIKDSAGTTFSIAGENEVHPSTPNGAGLTFGDITSTQVKISTGDTSLDWEAGFANALTVTPDSAKIIVQTII